MSPAEALGDRGQTNDGDLAIRSRLVQRIVCVRGDDSGPPFPSFSGSHRDRLTCDDPVENLRRNCWRGHEIAIPLGVLRSTAIGCDHDEIVAVREVEKRDRVFSARRTPLCCEEQHVVGDQPAADAATRCLVCRLVDCGQPLDVGVPHRISYESYEYCGIESAWYERRIVDRQLD